jgi:hypothetical protein
MGRKHECLNHPGVVASTTCHQCRRPICVNCTVVMAHGEFCSAECGALNRSAKEQRRAAKKIRPTAVTSLVGAFVIAVGLSVIFHLGVVSLDKDSKARKRLEHFDLWNLILSTPEKIEKQKQLDEQKKRRP